MLVSLVKPEPDVSVAARFRPFVRTQATSSTQAAAQRQLAALSAGPSGSPGAARAPHQGVSGWGEAPPAAAGKDGWPWGAGGGSLVPPSPAPQLQPHQNQMPAYLLPEQRLAQQQGFNAAAAGDAWGPALAPVSRGRGAAAAVPAAAGGAWGQQAERGAGGTVPAAILQVLSSARHVSHIHRLRSLPCVLHRPQPLLWQ